MIIIIAIIISSSSSSSSLSSVNAPALVTQTHMGWAQPPLGQSHAAPASRSATPPPTRNCNIINIYLYSYHSIALTTYLRTKCSWFPLMTSRMRRSYASGILTPLYLLPYDRSRSVCTYVSDPSQLHHRHHHHNTCVVSNDMPGFLTVHFR